MGHGDEMDVIGHEAIRQNLDFKGAAPPGKKFEVALAILITEKGRLSSISTLRDVMGKTWCDDASYSSHVPTLSNPQRPRKGLSMVSPESWCPRNPEPRSSVSGGVFRIERTHVGCVEGGSSVWLSATCLRFPYLPDRRTATIVRGGVGTVDLQGES
jgi:hypothetical protein